VQRRRREWQICVATAQPFIAVHRTELAGEIEQNVCKFFCAFGFPMKVKIINA
jgi:hypothetical protein